MHLIQLQSFRVSQAKVHPLKFAEGYVKDNNKEEGVINDKEAAVALVCNENKINIYYVNKVDIYSVDNFLAFFVKNSQKSIY